MNPRPNDEATLFELYERFYEINAAVFHSFFSRHQKGTFRVIAYPLPAVETGGYYSRPRFGAGLGAFAQIRFTFALNYATLNESIRRMFV